MGQTEVSLAEAKASRAGWGRGQLGFEGRGVAVRSIGVRRVITIPEGALKKRRNIITGKLNLQDFKKIPFCPVSSQSTNTINFFKRIHISQANIY